MQIKTEYCLGYHQSGTYFPIYPKSISGEKRLLKKWIFKRKFKQLERVLKEGQTIKVYTEIAHEEYKHEGRMADIKEDSLYLANKNDQLFAIAKEDIFKIKLPKQRSRDKKIGTGIAIGLAAIVLLIALLIISFASFLKLLGDKSSDTEKLQNGSCLTIFLMMGFGFLLIIALRPKYILKPFSQEWQITEAIDVPASSIP